MSLTDEARANLHRMTEIPAEVYIWTGVVILMLTIAAWLTTPPRETPEERADRIIRRNRKAENARTIAHIGTCGVTHNGMVCHRAKNHAPDFHTDWMAGKDGPLSWPVAEFGEAS